ncbi:MAG: penicillin-binding protein 2 [Syntrophobacteraceae bacterium]|nr:penicillin-binding protein 2 [Syntrophobacteraceae bacterium]
MKSTLLQRCRRHHALEKDGKKAKCDHLLLVSWEMTDADLFQKQYVLLIGLMLLMFVIFVLRLWHLQLVQGARYRYQSENNRIRLEDISAPRGIVFDRNGTPLVENRPAYHLQIIREDIQDLDRTVRVLAGLCNRNPEDFFAVIEANKSVPRFVPIRLQADLDRDCLARIEAQRIRLPGVVIQLEPKREYRWNGTAAHLIGYLSEITEMELKSGAYLGYSPGEDIGKFGVESAFEKYLHGKRGGRQVEVDAIGRRKRLLDEVLPIPGRNLWLTIDIELQKVAESCLEGKVGAIVAMDPNGGSVLALASSPVFDQEKFIRGLSKSEWQALSKDASHPLLNRAIGAAYPPGSTYKAFIALAALKEGVVNPDTRIHCPGYYQFADRKYRCWRDHGHGPVDVERALIQSCDVYFYQVGMRLGVDRIAHYANLFGLGEKTGLGLHGEHPGLIPSSWWKKQTTGIPWQKGETLSISIGQGFDLVTPLQLAVGYAAIANKGKVWQPYVVRRIEGDGQEKIDELGGKLKRTIPIESRYFDIVRKGLMGVVEDDRGTAHAIRLKSIPLAGKTGTAQVVRLAENVNRKAAARALKEKEKDHAWFVGYGPADNPRIVVCALVEHGGHGSTVAAPLVQKVISTYLSDPSRTSGS